MKRDEFTCKDCGNKGKLIVHHDEERFADILRKFMPENLQKRLSWIEETKIIEQVVDYHIEKNTSGITLCKSCHENRHKL